MLFGLGFTDTLTWLRDNDKLTEEQLADLRQAGQSNGHTNGHANGDAHGHAVQPFSDTESEEGVEEGKSLWRQVVSQTACEAPSCDESLKEAVVGKHYFHVDLCELAQRCLPCTQLSDRLALH